MPRRSKGDRLFNSSAYLNNATYNYYFEQLQQLSLSVFDWKNLPDTIDIRFLETALFWQGQAVFYYDDDLQEFVALRCAPSGSFNVYGIPTRRRAYGYNNYQRELSINDSVIIYNNEIRSNSVETCRLYAYKLANIARAIDINVNAQKTPILLKGSESQMLTLKNVYLKYDGNQPVMMADKDLDLSGFTVLKTDAPFVAPALKELHDAVWNEALTYLGICNVNIQKRARLITDEVLRSQGGTIASRYSRLNARQRAAEEINKMFGLDISVEFREGLSGEDPAFMFPDNRFDLQNDDGEVDKIG